MWDQSTSSLHHAHHHQSHIHANHPYHGNQAASPSASYPDMNTAVFVTSADTSGAGDLSNSSGAGGYSANVIHQSNLSGSSYQPNEVSDAEANYNHNGLNNHYPSAKYFMYNNINHVYHHHHYQRVKNGEHQLQDENGIDSDNNMAAYQLDYTPFINSDMFLSKDASDNNSGDASNTGMTTSKRHQYSRKQLQEQERRDQTRYVESNKEERFLEVQFNNYQDSHS